MRIAELELEVLHTFATFALYALAGGMFVFVMAPVFQRGPVATVAAVIAAGVLVAFMR